MKIVQAEFEFVVNAQLIVSRLTDFAASTLHDQVHDQFMSQPWSLNI